MVSFFALIFRTVSLSLHYGGPHPSRGWRSAFWAGSAVPSFLLGVIAGNLIRGVDLSAGGNYAGTIGSLFNPFAISVGVLSLALVANQGAAWAAMKVTGDLHPRTVWTARITGLVLLALFVLVSIYAAFALPDHAANVTRRPLGWLAILLTLGGLGYQQYSLARSRDSLSFVGACAAVVGLVGIWFTGTFPSIVPSLGQAAGGLTISNASAARSTLIVMTVILVPAAPLLVGVLIYVNRIFRGRVQGPGSDRGY
jgi:cytochrome d ubiquinol oxidase subunit II